MDKLTELENDFYKMLVRFQAGMRNRRKHGKNTN